MEQQSVNVEAAIPQAPVADQKPSDKEVNLRRLAQAKERAEAELDKERLEKAQLLQKLQHLEASSGDLEDDLEADGYVETPKLRKILSRFEQRIEQKIDKKAEEKTRRLFEEENQRSYQFRVKAEMPDFENVVTDDAANSFAERFPEWATTILNEPDNYKKRKLTYEAIKGLGLNKKAEVSIQEKVNQNQRNPYYYPSTVGNGPVQMGDFSESGKKAAYEKVKSLKKSFRGA